MLLKLLKFWRENVSGGERVAGRERKKEKWKNEEEKEKACTGLGRNVVIIYCSIFYGLPLANEKAIMTTTEKHSNVSDWFDKAILCRGCPSQMLFFVCQNIKLMTPFLYDMGNPSQCLILKFNNFLRNIFHG